MICNLSWFFSGLWRSPALIPPIRPIDRLASRRLLPTQVFTAGYSAPRSNTGVLEQLLATRHDIAAMLGASSYAHYQARECCVRVKN